MMKKILLLLLLLFNFIYPSDTISIIATANVHGETDPCG